ncbi:50S ribosomal protein L19 [Candidatus Dependentiae bacterium]|nr:50S ribosomal protein L19 [Candidatus Dependentiae bacterium]
MTERNFPAFKVGDTIEVSQTVKDGDKERTQLFTGDVIAMHNNGIASTVTVRRIGANGIGVEKIFPYYTPSVTAMRVVKYGVARRAKLFYLRDRVGNAARIEERVMTKAQKTVLKEANAASEAA